MAITALTGLAPEWYTPLQPEGDRVTRFKLKPLNGLQNLEVSSEIGSGRVGEAQKLALKYGLIDWENLDDENGRAISFSFDKIQLLPVDVLSDISVRIIRGSRLDENASKN